MARSLLITGVSGGIGRAIAALFGRNGWDVAGIDLAAPPPELALSSFVKGDVGLPETWDEALAGLARLDALVNNAAFQVAKPLVETTTEEWDAVVAANLRSAYLSLRAAHALLRAAKGAVVNVASVHAVATSENISAYAASKGGLVALTRAAALELARDGIRVNAVLPGAVDTAMLEVGLARLHEAEADSAPAKAALAHRTPQGRIGQPEEIAQAVYFLTDPERAGFITGQTLIVDGGATARLSTE